MPSIPARRAETQPQTEQPEPHPARVFQPDIGGGKVGDIVPTANGTGDLLPPAVPLHKRIEGAFRDAAAHLLTMAQAFLLVYIAYRDAGAGAWARLSTIAKEVRCKRATAQRALQALVDKGLLTVEKRPGKPSVYRLARGHLGPNGPTYLGPNGPTYLGPNGPTHQNKKKNKAGNNATTTTNAGTTTIDARRNRGGGGDYESEVREYAKRIQTTTNGEVVGDWLDLVRDPSEFERYGSIGAAKRAWRTFNRKRPSAEEHRVLAAQRQADNARRCESCNGIESKAIVLREDGVCEACVKHHGEPLPDGGRLSR